MKRAENEAFFYLKKRCNFLYKQFRSKWVNHFTYTFISFYPKIYEYIVFDEYEISCNLLGKLTIINE